LRLRRHRLRQPRRRTLPGSGSLRPRSPRRRPSVLRLRPSLLPRLPPGEARDRDRPRGAARSAAGPPPRSLRPGTSHHGTRLPLPPVAPRALLNQRGARPLAPSGQSPPGPPSPLASLGRAPRPRSSPQERRVGRGATPNPSGRGDVAGAPMTPDEPRARVERSRRPRIEAETPSPLPRAHSPLASLGRPLRPENPSRDVGRGGTT